MIPRIDPVPAQVARPLWSVMIPTYNCARYLGRALESVLVQDPGPKQMQIEVVDDCSTKDDPAAVVREVGNGRVLFHRNQENIRNASNFNICISRSRGHLIHILNGDDYVAPFFYQRFENEFANAPGCAILFAQAFLVGEREEPLGISKFCSSLAEASSDPCEFLLTNPIRTPGVVVRRSFYEQCGGFDADLVQIHDWELWVRAIVHGGAQMLNEPLAYYRVHDDSATSRVIRSGENLPDLVRLSAKWKAEGMPGFDPVRFDRKTGGLAIFQLLRAALHRDGAAVAAIWRLWREQVTLRLLPWACYEASLLVVGIVWQRAHKAIRRG